MMRTLSKVVFELNSRLESYRYDETIKRVAVIKAIKLTKSSLLFVRSLNTIVRGLPDELPYSESYDNASLEHKAECYRLQFGVSDIEHNYRKHKLFVRDLLKKHINHTMKITCNQVIKTISLSNTNLVSSENNSRNATLRVLKVNR